jgi:protein-S-isoprenylcysteine O-methyltransferase
MIVQWLGIAWGVSELAFGVMKRADRTSASRRDAGSLPLLWLAIGASMFVAIVCARRHLAPMPFAPRGIAAVALVLFVAGVALRIAAIATLKRSFTVDVAVRPDQTIIRHGVYRFLRHPSYSGAILSFIGLGVAFGDWLSLAALAIGVTLAFANRIRVEERVLREAFGAAYDEYARTTKRLVPGVF